MVLGVLFSLGNFIMQAFSELIVSWVSLTVMQKRHTMQLQTFYYEDLSENNDILFCNQRTETDYDYIMRIHHSAIIICSSN
jgi:predicted HD phosphohydrolase